MKTLRNLLIITLILTMTSESYSQTFGVKAGLNFSNMLIKNNDTKYDTKTLTGFLIGGSAEFPINKMFYVETGLEFSKKGVKSTTSTNDKYEIFYMDIPVMAKARFEVNPVKLYGVLGPYFGIGLGGKTYYDGEGTNIKWGSDSEKDDFKRLDVGLNIGAGVEYQAFELRLTYGLGLINISPYTSNGYTESNRVLAVTVGYIFGGK